MDPVTIIQGKAATIALTLRDQDGDPYSLSAITALTTCFQKADGTELMLGIGTGITIVNAVLGKLSIALTAAQTALLQTVDLETLELSLTTSGDPFGVQIPGAYAVVLSKC